MIDWSKEQYHEPRSFTIKNIRDMFFALQNISQAQSRTNDAEERIRELQDKCDDLTKTTQELEASIATNRREVDRTHQDHVERWQKTQGINENNFERLLKKIRINTDQLETHSKQVEELRSFQQNQIRVNDKTQKIIRENK